MGARRWMLDVLTLSRTKLLLSPLTHPPDNSSPSRPAIQAVSVMQTDGGYSQHLSIIS